MKKYTNRKNQKEYFGESYKNINNIECAPPNGQGQTEVCQVAKIQSYPTWELGNGTRIEGEIPSKTLSFEQFLEMTECKN